ncbi:MAG: SusD/RagB family nutrient-binding outer membrane lipoprotein [Mucilaginibacter polytrichastri]|nr:SusD/RagB family nutrient-binding outer membrane lipoprotein [Mucilaginibacter polytrichastri]
MKKTNLCIFLFSLVLISATGCKKTFEDNFKNPNQPEEVPPNLVFISILKSMYEAPFSDAERWGQYTACNYFYYGNNRYDWTGSPYWQNDYINLKNVSKMEEEANRTGGDVAKSYLALAKFFKAYFYVRLSLQVGDVPMSEAIKGSENLSPKYDTQKAVFTQALTWLDEANTDLAAAIASGTASLQGDIYLGNDLSKWQKAVNTFHLRVLIALSRKSDDNDLQVKQQFAAIVGNTGKYPIQTGMGDNVQFVYNDTFDKYPNNRDNFGFDALRFNMAGTYIGALTALKDPRVFVVAEPARGLAERNGYALTDFRSFVGSSSGEDQAIMSEKAQTGLYSFINRFKYYSGYQAEETFIIGYPELCFNIAEGINRGWANGNAEDWYRKGIQASIAFYDIKDGENTVTFLRKDGVLGQYENYTVNFNFANYYSQTPVKYAGNNTQGLQQILTQKYLAFARNSGYEAYYQYRRTGIPAFQTGPGTGNSGRIPKRFQYPTVERTTNGTNLQSALASQYNGTDDINATPWIVQ